ncbi:MAG: Chaperone SurA precursor [Pseudomonadota bacterium]
MNKPLTSILSGLLVALLGSVAVASLAATPSAAVQTVNRIVAVVNSEPVTDHEVQQVSAQLAQENARAPQRLSANELYKLALDRLITEKALQQQARDTGITIDKDAIDQAEMNVAANNQITLEQLHQRLPQEGLTVAAFREKLKGQLLINRLREREVEGKARVSDLEAEQYLQTLLAKQASQTPQELNLAMILVAVPEGASADVRQQKLTLAREIARKARAGESFEALARQYSNAADKGANGGELGLRTEDRYPELFVQAVARLKTGEISDPVESGAGFHVLKLLQRKAGTAALSVMQTHPRHILLRTSSQMSQAQAVAKLQGLRQQIVSRKAEFAQVARQWSQDGSAPSGGDLGWVRAGMFVPEFEQVMDRLPLNTVSEPVVSRFGVHLIEVLERKPMPVSSADAREIARNALREKKIEEAYTRWVEDVRSRAYVEMRDSPQ